MLVTWLWFDVGKKEETTRLETSPTGIVLWFDVGKKEETTDSLCVV